MKTTIYKKITVGVLVFSTAVLFMRNTIKVQNFYKKSVSELKRLIPHDQFVLKATHVNIDRETKQIIDSTPSKHSPTPIIPNKKNSTTVQLLPIPSALYTTGYRHEYQTWNNCGPATLAMGLSRYDKKHNQKVVASIVKSNEDDKNVNLEELAYYVNNHTQLKALIRVNGDDALIKKVLSNNLTIIVETWFEPKPGDGMGHYRLVTGYDTTKNILRFHDSYKGPNFDIDAVSFDKDWKVYNRAYLIIYPEKNLPLVKEIVGNNYDEMQNWKNALQRANEEIKINKNDAYSWFNRGTALTNLKQYASGAKAYDVARSLGLPWRMLWYQFSIFQAYLSTNRADDVIKLTGENLKQTNQLEESYYYLGKAWELKENKEEAISNYQNALNLNPSYYEAKQALNRLEAIRQK